MFKDFLNHIAEFIADFFSKEESWFILFFLGMVIVIPFFSISDFWAVIVSFIKLTWWFWIFSPLFLLWRAIFLHIQRERFKRKMKSALFEMQVPRNMEKSPKAMEQILSTMQTLRSAPRNSVEKYLKGKVPLWFSLELVSFGGKLRFFIRTPEENKDVVEAAFFSYYTNVELQEVNDYMDLFPKTSREILEQNREIWGTEYILARDDAYPIKTYTHFESDAITKHDETKQIEIKQFDPISNLLEVLGKVREGEVACVHILIEPADSDWKDAWDDLILKLKTPKTVDVGKGEDKKTIPMHSPGHEETLKEVERNLSKQAFETLIRVFYISPKEIFSDAYIKSGVLGAFNQYSSPNFNAFKANPAVGTKLGGHMKFLWKTRRTDYHKEMFFHNARNRLLPPESWIGRLLTSYPFGFNFASKKFIMNVEALATIFHPPASLVLTSPHMKRVESRKTGPQSGLDIFGDENEIEKFK